MKISSELLSELESGKQDERIQEIYVDEELLSGQKERYCEAIKQYVEIFGVGEVEIYSAPGRSEVGGNHTDHQHGEVLAAAVNLDAIAVVGRTADNKIHLQSQGYQMITLDLGMLEYQEQEEGTSMGLIRGMAYGLQKSGYLIGGFQAYVTSDVLGGAGLSSSAAFEVLVGTVLSGFYNKMKISPVEIAKTAQYAENVYFGKPCGLMDQMACSVGGLIHIDFEDIENPLVEKVEVDFSAYGHSLCVTDTKGSHADLTDDYAAIPMEMKRVARFFGKEFLREVKKKDFDRNIAKLRAEMGDRPVLRALHFFKEDERVRQQVQALQAGNFKEFLRLVEQSGNSSFKYLQNIYTNKDVQNQAMSIGLAVSESILLDSGVARVHGGGFAGTIQAFVKNEFVDTYKETLEGIYGTGSCHVLKVRPFGGMKVL